MKGPPRLPKQVFFEEPLVDALVNSLTSLAMEVSVVRERLDTLERVLVDEGISATELIESHVPDHETRQARVEARLRIIRSTLDPLKDHFARSSTQDDDTSEG